MADKNDPKEADDKAKPVPVQPVDEQAQEDAANERKRTGGYQ